MLFTLHQPQHWLIFASSAASSTSANAARCGMVKGIGYEFGMNALLSIPATRNPLQPGRDVMKQIDDERRLQS